MIKTVISLGSAGSVGSADRRSAVPQIGLTPSFKRSTSFGTLFFSFFFFFYFLFFSFSYFLLGGSGAREGVALSSN